MTALVTQNLPVLADAPQGISKLRQLILELAVRGLLLPQDVADVPASRDLELLARGRLRRGAGRSQKFREVSDADAAEPHSIPPSWQWCKLADLVSVLNGRAYKKEELLAAGTPVLRVGNLFTSNHWYYSDLVLDDDKYCEAGDLIFAWSASFGPFIWSGDRVIYHYHIWKLRPHVETAISKLYLNLFLQERTQAIKAAGHGVSMAHMTKEKMEALPVALPPLDEQHRIVAKVDELMALCDRLEARQQDAEAAHERLVQALLDSLTDASDADEFQSCWQRLCALFPALFTTEGSVAALRQAIVDWASKSQLSAVAVGELPPEWRRIHLGDVVQHSAAGWSPSCHPRPREDGEWGVLKVSAVSWGTFQPQENKALPANLEPRPDLEVQAGDFLISRANTAELVARSVVVDTTPPRLMLSDKVVRLRFNDSCDVRYMQICNSSSHARGYYARVAGGTSSSMKNVSRAQILELPVLLPPLAEQRRLVAVTSKLLAICDALEAAVAAARAKHEALAAALVERASRGEAKRHQPDAVDSKEAALASA